MTIIDCRGRGATIIGLAAVVLAACGGAAAPSPESTLSLTTAVPLTATPVPAMPEPTPKVTEAPTAAPVTPDPGSNGGFAYPASEVIGYYAGLGFECMAPEASTQATGYTIQRCTRAAQADDQVHVVAIVTGPDGVPGDAIAAVIANDGVTMPTPAQSLDHLSRFVGVMLGGEMGMDPSVWLVKNLGAESEQTTAGDLAVTTYRVNDDTGAGLFLEMANQGFLDAATP
ncbi:MAG: hypothetical protein MUQ32_01420 [Chloroflexi bacterium]|nr:hypothetical protein [Chloroflexota bacterium]